MKITAINAPSFVKHLGIISQLAGPNCAPYPFDIYGKLKRLENRANYIATLECNGEILEDVADKKMEAIKKKVAELLPGLKTFFVNGDPRGYSLKIKESEAKELGIYTDWGGYGILAPEF